MATKKYIDFPEGVYDPNKIFLQADPVTGALEKINLPFLVNQKISILDVQRVVDSDPTAEFITDEIGLGIDYVDFSEKIVEIYFLNPVGYDPSKFMIICLPTACDTAKFSGAMFYGDYMYLAIEWNPNPPVSFTQWAFLFWIVQIKA